MAVAVRRSVLLFGSSVELNLLHKNRLPGFGRSGPLVVAGGCGTRRCIHISPAEVRMDIFITCVFHIEKINIMCCVL